MPRTFALAAVALPLVIAGCTPTASAPAVPAESIAAPSPSTSPGEQVLPPAVVSPGDLAGTDVSVSIGSALVVAVPDGTEAEWTGTTADVTIAEFSAGGPSEGAVFRPGFVARALGTTAATVTGPDGQQVDFTISVVAP
ncbi:hypothetical protein SAMN04487848_2257 [Microbacterium sp. ru370.1]|uniref:hypothetical protein n=1 Tax=unclassified Microbacterium TaxID=2609290 RepID=UPI000888C2D6|nr:MULTISPECIES: hypothetical protein [unclassified Microbacterium]SDO81492.1 hypothetical protein SAMN04487848_2257 [Microbacterium sp. ru370.1]SIT89807.1 hypothetical protein SAMN05880579_2252 [Microbacterium sp. RU1D]